MMELNSRKEPKCCDDDLCDKIRCIVEEMKKGEITSEEVRGRIKILEEDYCYCDLFSKAGWGTGDTSLDEMLNIFRTLFPYLEKGTRAVQIREEIRIFFNFEMNRSSKGKIREKKEKLWKMISDAGFIPQDFEFSEEGREFDEIIRCRLISEAREMYEGVLRSEEAKGSNPKGWKTFYNFCKKNNLTIKDL